MKGKALRRALQTSDVIRVGSEVPLIQDTTELITPQTAEEMLTRNKNNRPINWQAVEKWANVMASGGWKLHSQGIILDDQGNILTGQTRLWAVVYGGVGVYMRVSRGSPSDTANVIDRGRPQSSRDLATRRTERRHGPTEASIARCVCVLRGKTKPTADDIADILTGKDNILKAICETSIGAKKTKSMLMVLGAICNASSDRTSAVRLTKNLQALSGELEMSLLPYIAAACWGKGAAFGMALEKARAIVDKNAA